jgi:hypothetical protein
MISFDNHDILYKLFLLFETVTIGDIQRENLQVVCIIELVIGTPAGGGLHGLDQTRRFFFQDKWSANESESQLITGRRTGSKPDSASRVWRTAATGPGGGKTSSWGTWKENRGLHSESAVMISRFCGKGLRTVSHGSFAAAEPALSGALMH